MGHPMTETVEIPPILRKAREILAKNGRAFGDYVNMTQHWEGLALDECPVCVVGAINIAAGLDSFNPWTLATTEDELGRIRAAMAATGLLARHLGLIRDESDLHDVQYLLDAVGATWHDNASDDELFAALAAVSEAS